MTHIEFVLLISFIFDMLTVLSKTGQLCGEHRQEQQHHQGGAGRLRHRLIQPQQSSIRGRRIGQGDRTS